MNDIYADQPRELNKCSCHIYIGTIRSGNAPTLNYMRKNMWFASVNTLLITYIAPKFERTQSKILSFSTCIKFVYTSSFLYERLVHLQV